MRRFIQAGALAVLALVPQALLAQDVLPRPLAAQEDLTFKTAGEGIVALWDNVYIGPYTGDITSGNPTIPGITLYCVDFANEVNFGQSWTANVTNLGPATTDADMGNTRLGTAAGSVDRYRQSAFLASLFSSWSDYTSLTYGGGTAYANQRGVYSGIAAAIWSIMTNGFPSTTLGVNNPALAAAMADPFVQLAMSTDLSTRNFSNWSVLTDTRLPGGTQEFVVQTTSVTPEPETYALLFTGFVLLFGVARLKKRKLTDLA